MIGNHIKLAFRSLFGRKAHTLINIAGLAVGIAVCLVIFVVIRFELSFDNYHTKKDRIYRVLTEFHHADMPEAFYSNGVPFALPAALKPAIPEIEESSVIFAVGEAQILVLDESGNTQKKFKENSGVFFTEPSLFRIFDIDWLAGDAAVLSDPGKVVLSRDIARKYFGSWEVALGRHIKWDDQEVLEVAGVLENPPLNTDLQMGIVISYGTGYTKQFAEMGDWDGVNGNLGCYVLLPPGVSQSSVTSKLRSLAEANKREGNEDSATLQSLAEIHYDTDTGNYSDKAISKNMINALWLVAGFILLIACVNFINLATAQTFIRNKEIGIRKVLGGSRTQLKLQFLTETFLIVSMAMVLALLLTFLSLDYAGELLDLPLSYQMLASSEVVLFMGIILLAVTLLAGIYPAATMSRFSPIEAFRHQLAKIGTEGISLRRALVVFQFVIAQALIFGTLIIVEQMDYFLNQPLGFVKESMLTLPVPRDSVSISKLDYLKNELTSVEGVRDVSFSSDSPTEDGNSWTTFAFDRATEETDFYAIRKGIDADFIPAYGLELVVGRNFRHQNKNKEFLVNETLVKKLGFAEPGQVLDKEINLWEGEVVGTVVGVVKDFHERSLKEEIAPVMLVNEPEWFGLAGIRFVPAEATGVLKSVEGIWSNTYPSQVFEYQFLDNKIANYYQQEKRLSKMYRLAAVLAIFLSCLGLYGLTSFMITERTKEAGIRKVLGANIGQIVYLFSREFMLLIAVAFVIASPLAGYLMTQWLENYSYHIDITIWVYMTGGVMAMCIALATIGYQTIKVAIANPVDSLRTE